MSDAPNNGKPKVIPIEEQITGLMQAAPILKAYSDLVDSAIEAGKITGLAQTAQIFTAYLEFIKATGREDARAEMVDRVNSAIKTLGLVRDNQAAFRAILSKKTK
jgi:hypothetical protein